MRVRADKRTVACVESVDICTNVTDKDEDNWLQG